MLVADDQPPASYSVRIEPTGARLHSLYWGRCAEVTSSDPARVLDALVLHLDSHLVAPPNTVRLHVHAIVRHSTAVLVPKLFTEALRVDRRRLQEAGWELLDAPFVAVDLALGEILVTRRIPVDPSALVEAASLGRRRRRDEGVANGRYRVARWLFIEPFSAQASYSRAAFTRIAMSAVDDSTTADGIEAFRQLPAVYDRVEVVGVPVDWNEGARSLLLAE